MEDKIEQKVSADVAAQGDVKLIDVKMDKYKGVIIKNMDLLAPTEEEFDLQLAASL